MGTGPRRIKKGRLTPAERYLVALYRADRTIGKVEFHGLALDLRHASEVITGDRMKIVQNLSNLVNGKYRKMQKPYQDWYAVKINIPLKSTIFPDDVVKMTDKATKLAELKLAALGIVELRGQALKKLTVEQVDGLHNAMAQIKTNAEPVMTIKPKVVDPDDEWNVFYNPGDGLSDDPPEAFEGEQL